MKIGKIGGTWFLIILIAVGAIFFAVVRPFLIAILLAAIAAGLLFPVFKWIRRKIWDNQSFSSIACVMLVLLLFIVPILSLLGLFTVQAFQFKDTADDTIKEIVEKGPDWFEKAKTHKFLEKLPIEEIDWKSKAGEAAQFISTLLIKMISKTSQSALHTFAMLAIMLYTLYYFLIDGPSFLERLKYLSPLKDEYDERILAKFISITRATLKGTILIGIVQGGLGGIAFVIFGVSSPVFWGTVMMIISIIPGVGSAIVWVPAAIIKMATGHIGQGIGILIAGLVICTLDNLMRPRLVGRDTKMHDLLIFFSTLGGIVLFGIVGFILGPIIAAVFVTVIDIYGTIYRDELERQNLPESANGGG